MAIINSASALSQFDDLVTRGELFYTPSTPIILNDSGLDYDIRSIPSFAQKPLPSSTATAQPSNRPPPTDGSDIDHTDPLFFVANINDTHKLILNKFCVYRPQYLLLTLDPLRRQTEPLDQGDVRAVWGVLGGLDCDGGGEDAVAREGKEGEEGKEEGKKGGKGKKHYAIYNGGAAGGSSRKHKHMQILARPSASDGELELLPYRAQGAQMDKLPIVAFFTPLDTRSLSELSDEEAGSVVYGVVEKQWMLARSVLREGTCRNQDQHQDDYKGGGGQKEMDTEESKEDGDELVPHNVMLTRDWVITIPRRAATIENKLKGHVVGCQGVLGSVWCAKEEQLEAWKEVGMGNVLRELGVPGKVEYC